MLRTLAWTLRRLAGGIPLVIGVTLVSFLLMVYFGPDQTFELLGKNPTQQQIDELRAELGYDQPFLTRYASFLREVATLDFGFSNSTGERVTALLARTIPVSLALILPGFVLGHLIALALAMLAARRRGQPLDRVVMGLAVTGMSISFLIVVIGFQVIFSSSGGLDLFPVRGWNVQSLADYLWYVTVPTLCLVFVAVGYDTRFYRAVFAEELSRDHVRTARAWGLPEHVVLVKHVLRNSLVPVTTRIMFSIPQVAIGGSLIIESYFGIPGVGKVTYDAIVTGDQPVLKAVVTLTAILFVVVVTLTDLLYRVVDPRVVRE
jgi:peptide/nickel transport system permease protein